MATLNYHMAASLDEEMLRPHQCVFCGRRFKRKDHRIEHERIHTGERPYPCPSCGRAFVQKHQLMSHIRRKHSADSGSNHPGLNLVVAGSNMMSSHHRPHANINVSNLPPPLSLPPLHVASLPPQIQPHQNSSIDSPMEHRHF